MCLIIHKPSGLLVPAHVLDNAEDKNPDGFGAVFLDTGEVVRTMDYARAREVVETDRPAVFHWRYATVGSVELKNCHPFDFERNGRGWQLFSNGTVESLGDESKPDTECVAELLADIPEKHWGAVLAMTATRFALVSGGKVRRFGKWHEREGIYYSKANCFAREVFSPWRDSFYESGLWSEEGDAWEDWGDDDDSLPPAGDMVAVYGTLKRGRGNHRYLDGCQFLDGGLTVDCLPMVDHGIPYVYDEPGVGGRIVVEVYRVDDISSWQGLDALEGHPEHYARKMVSVELDSGEVVTCWLYFACHPRFSADSLITEF